MEIQYNHSKDKALARFINKTDSTKININRRNSGSIQHQLWTTPFDACLHKIEYKRTQAKIQHLDRYLTHILTHHLVPP
jgi:hypothetical protein